MNKLPALAGALALTFALPAAANGAHDTADRSSAEQQLRHEITAHRLAVWRWQDRMHRQRSFYAHRATNASERLLWRLQRYWEHLHYLIRWVRWPEYQATLAPAIGHYAGWMCIHRGEGSWNAQTGNGFYGGLQMTYGWMGLVANAALLPPAQQIEAAEVGYQRSGYSNAWLAGQWPNTYPPCAAMF